MSSATYDQPVQVSATRSIKSVMDSPNWPSNLLWLTIAVLLQSFVVGQIFIFGYGAELLHDRAGFPGRKSPDIDSNRLGDYFMKGLWPFLVYLIASVAVSIVVVIPLVVVAIVLAAIVGAMGEVAGIMFPIVMVPLSFLLIIPMISILAPITIRAMLCQDFAASFDFAWCMSFIRLTFREMLVSSLVFAVLSTAIYFVGLALFCVGALPAAGLISGAMMHLLAQWYELFLSRGGEMVTPATTSIVDASVV